MMLEVSAAYSVSTGCNVRDVQVVSNVTERRSKMKRHATAFSVFGDRPSINNFQFEKKEKIGEKMCTIIYEKCSSLNLNLHPFLINSHFVRFGLASFQAIFN